MRTVKALDADKEKHEEHYEKDEHETAGVELKQGDIEEIAAKLTGLPKDTIKIAFNGAWDAICGVLEDGNSVKLHGKGRFYLSKRSSRIGRNPLTGEEYDVPEREAMAFQTSPAYSKRLRKHREERAEQEAKEAKEA